MKPQKSSAYRPPASAATPAPGLPADGKVHLNVWEPDPWPERSEEFYQSIYGTGKCKFCGHPILSWKDMCDCDAMKSAREAFKRKIRPAAPAPSVATPASSYNPNEYIEPVSREIDPEVEPEQGTFL